MGRSPSRYAPGVRHRTDGRDRVAQAAEAGENFQRGKGYEMKIAGNIIWLVLAGFWLCIGYLIAGVLNCIFIITIPFGSSCSSSPGLRSGHSAGPLQIDPALRP